MSVDRFILLYHTMLHVCHSDPETSGRGHKITPLISTLIEKFNEHYEPYQEISVDESMIGFKGRVIFRMYCPKKPTKWGLLVKTVACPHTGYLLNAHLYCGRNDDRNVEPGLTKTEQYFLDLLTPFANKGHHVFCDRLYSSVTLAEKLYERKFHVTGTIMPNRKHLPAEIKNPSGIQKGEIRAFRSSNILCLCWKDKRVVTMISTYHKGNETIIKNVRGRGDAEKPVVVEEYNKHMSEVDLHDQMNKYYDHSRKSVKWWKKVFFG